jgi:sulfotransferase
MKQQRIFFNSSLPRAGSTLLSNVVGHHPNFFVSPTSALIDLVLGSRIGYNSERETSYTDTEIWKKGFINFNRYGLAGFMNAVSDKPYHLDKSRMWAAYYDLLNMIVPNPKVVVMVRDLRAIYASMEKKFRENPDVDERIMDNIKMTGITTAQRVTHWSQTHPVGYSIIKLEELILQKLDKNILFFRYEDFCQYPDEHMKKLYEFFQVEYFQHDWNNIQQITSENDAAHGIFGDHKIRNKLERKPDDFREILGDYTSNRIVNESKWFFEYFGYL